uniref:Uncharacterized protein n=1 Tax=Arundo donax TaxID=35708 RepID=A0A0A9A3Z1_ARUDO
MPARSRISIIYWR